MAARILEYRGTGSDFNRAYERYTLAPSFSGLFVSDVERPEQALSEEARLEETVRKWQDLALKVAEDTYHMSRHAAGLITERSRHNYAQLSGMIEVDGRNLGREGVEGRARVGLPK